MIRLNVLALLICIGMSSCYEDSLTDTTTTTTFTPGTRYVHDISGYVMDDEGTAIGAATITIGDYEAIADADGHFEIRGVEITDQGVYVQATREGYASAGTIAYSSSSLIAKVSIVLLADGVVGVLRGEEGGAVMGDNDLELVFEPGSILKDGAIYNDEVFVSILQIDHSVQNANAHTVRAYDLGDDEGQRIGKISPLLQIEVSLRDAANNVLTLREDFPARASFQVPDKENAVMNDLALYSFDANEGLWKFEKDIENGGGIVSVELTHFSWWQVGVSDPVDDLCLTFKSPDGTTPVDDVFTIQNGDGGFIHFGIITYGETVCIPVPSNAALIVKAYNFCLTAFSETVIEVGDLILPTSVEIEIDQRSGLLMLSGEILDCNGDVLTNDVVVTSQEGKGTGVSLGTFNGTYQFDFGDCNTDLGEGLIFYDPGSQGIFTISSEEILEGPRERDITLCPAEETFLVIDGVVYFNCQAKQNKEETIVYIEDGNLLLGFDTPDGGVSTGTPCRLFTPHFHEEGIAVISKYEDVGGIIEGTFSTKRIGDDEAVNGSFRAAILR